MRGLHLEAPRKLTEKKICFFGLGVPGGNTSSKFQVLWNLWRTYQKKQFLWEKGFKLWRRLKRFAMQLHFFPKACQEYWWGAWRKMRISHLLHWASQQIGSPPAHSLQKQLHGLLHATCPLERHNNLQKLFAFRKVGESLLIDFWVNRCRDM